MKFWLNYQVKLKGVGMNEITSNKKGLSTGLKILIGFGIFIVLFFAYAISVYNKIVIADENLKASWSQVENQYKRRADLIPNFVNTVKGYAKHEKETLEGVISARARATSINIDISKATKEDIDRFAKAQSGLSSALSRLLAVSEKYPNLKANENFMALQTELEGTENRIAVARMDYIKNVNRYNVMIRRFPNSFFATIFGLGGAKPAFSISSEEAKTPVVSF